MHRNKDTYKNIDQNLRVVQTLAMLLGGVDAGEQFGGHLLQSCARILIREADAALEHLDQLQENDGSC